MVEVKKDDIKKIRTLRLFIDATAQIIEDEGIEGVTIREVAKITGYNSATIYNYFDNCNELISFAAMKFISDYVQAMPEYIAEANNALEEFLAVWQCFCEYCFQDPQIYYAIFTADIGDKPEDLIKDYYTLFPDDLGEPPKELVPMLMESDFSRRCEILIKPCVEADYFTPQQAEEINELIRLIYQGMLSLMINNRIDYSTEEAVERTMKHIRMVVNERAKVN